MKKIYILETALLALLLCSCGSQAQTDSQNIASETTTEAVIEEELYSDQEADIRIYTTDLESNRYHIVKGDAEGYIDADIICKDMREIRVDTLGEEMPFLTVVIADRASEYVAVLDAEMLGEIKIKNPYEIIKGYIKSEMSPEGTEMTLICGEEKMQFTADNSKALEIMIESIQTEKNIGFGMEDTEIYAEIPITVSEDSRIGSFKLYYEFDGAGLNCVRTEFST